MNQYARIHLLITIVLAVAILIVFGQLFFIAFLLPWVAVTIISSRYPINQATNILVMIILVFIVPHVVRRQHSKYWWGNGSYNIIHFDDDVGLLLYTRRA